MSIDAKIVAIKVGADSVSLILGPRDKRELPGQPELYIDDFDGWLPNIGDEIWGNSSHLYIGNTRVYNRIGYTHIRRV